MNTLSLLLVILFFCVAAVSGIAIFLYNKLKAERTNSTIKYNTAFEEFSKKEKDHEVLVEQLKTNHTSELAYLKKESLASVKNSQSESKEATDQIQNMYQYIDSLLETIDELSDMYEKLKDYSFELHSRAMELNLYLLNKLRGGFLEDNDEVREFVGQVKNFLRDSQEIQNQYGDLFLVEDDEDRMINLEDEDVELGMEELFDGEESDDEQQVEDSISQIEAMFPIKRKYNSEKYE